MFRNVAETLTFIKYVRKVCRSIYIFIISGKKIGREGEREREREGREKHTKQPSLKTSLNVCTLPKYIQINMKRESI